MIFLGIEKLLNKKGIYLELGKIVVDIKETSPETFDKIKDIQKLAKQCGSFVTVEKR